MISLSSCLNTLLGSVRSDIFVEMRDLTVIHPTVIPELRQERHLCRTRYPTVIPQLRQERHPCSNRPPKNAFPSSVRSEIILEPSAQPSFPTPSGAASFA